MSQNYNQQFLVGCIIHFCTCIWQFVAYSLIKSLLCLHLFNINMCYQPFENVANTKPCPSSILQPYTNQCFGKNWFTGRNMLSLLGFGIFFFNVILICKYIFCFVICTCVSQTIYELKILIKYIKIRSSKVDRKYSHTIILFTIRRRIRIHNLYSQSQAREPSLVST